MTAWRDQVALVTGGARIIGRAMARLLARSAFFHRLRSSGATNPYDDWHRSLDQRRTQSRHWRRSRSPLSATWRRVEKVRLDRASGGERRIEVTIVHELVEFGTIPGDAQTF
jgi:NAD(P)-dependent dehydrogenase (short-subunit alcohol dehydrogenase family)